MIRSESIKKLFYNLYKIYPFNECDDSMRDGVAITLLSGKRQQLPNTEKTIVVSFLIGRPDNVIKIGIFKRIL